MGGFALIVVVVGTAAAAAALGVGQDYPVEARR
jgi:hypothetical protein